MEYLKEFSQANQICPLSKKPIKQPDLIKDDSICQKSQSAENQYKSIRVTLRVRRIEEKMQTNLNKEISEQTPILKQNLLNQNQQSNKLSQSIIEMQQVIEQLIKQTQEWKTRYQQLQKQNKILQVTLQQQKQTQEILYQIVNRFNFQKQQLKKRFDIKIQSKQIIIQNKYCNQLEQMKDYLSSSFYISSIKARWDEIRKLRAYSYEDSKEIQKLQKRQQQLNQYIETLKKQKSFINERLINLQKTQMENNFLIKKLQQQFEQQVNKKVKENQQQFIKLKKRLQKSISDMSSKIKYLEMDVKITDLLKNHAEKQKMKMKQQIEQIRQFFKLYEKQFKLFDKYNEELNHGYNRYKYLKWRLQQKNQNQQSQKQKKYLQDYKQQLQKKILIVQNYQYDCFIDKLQMSNISAISDSCYSVSENQPNYDSIVFKLQDEKQKISDVTLKINKVYQQC